MGGGEAAADGTVRTASQALGGKQQQQPQEGSWRPADLTAWDARTLQVRPPPDDVLPVVWQPRGCGAARAAVGPSISLTFYLVALTSPHSPPADLADGDSHPRGHHTAGGSLEKR